MPDIWGDFSLEEMMIAQEIINNPVTNEEFNEEIEKIGEVVKVEKLRRKKSKGRKHGIKDSV